MDDLDRALARLADVPAPHALDDMEARVFARIGAQSTPRTGLHIGAVVVAALAIGVVGGGVPATASSPASLSPLAGGSPLAPSTLLAGAP
jgi:hypothetical protein